MTHSNYDKEEMIELLQQLAEKYRFPEIDHHTGGCADCGITFYPVIDHLQASNYSEHLPDCQWAFFSKQLERYCLPYPSENQSQIEAEGINCGKNISWWVAPDTGRRLVRTYSLTEETGCAEKDHYGLRVNSNTVHGKFTEADQLKSEQENTKFVILKEALVLESDSHGTVIETGEYKIPKLGDLYKIGKSVQLCEKEQPSGSSTVYDYAIFEPFEFEFKYQTIQL